MNRWASVLTVAAGTMGSTPVAGSAQTTCSAPALATLIYSVRDAGTRVPLVDAVVTAVWAGAVPTVVRTDSTGKARICAPTGTNIEVRAQYHGKSGSSRLRMLEGRPTEFFATIDVPAYVLRGVVLDNATSRPLPSVAVQLANTSISTITDADGRFSFARVPSGKYTMRVSHIAYAPLAQTVAVDNDDLNAAIRLTETPIDIAPIIVTAFSQRLVDVGFYEREKRGVGTFIGKKQVEAMNVQRASDLMRRIPSARIIPQSNRRNNAPPNILTGRGGCRYRFVVDGTRTLADFEMDIVQAFVIEGVEIYAGLAEVPAIFRMVAVPESGPPLCGVIVIWTRNGR